MNKLSLGEEVQIITLLVEGNSIRSTCRITGCAKGTVTRLLARVGQVCQAYQDEVIHGLKSKLIQCDEIWSFCYSKQKNVPEKYKGKFGYGDVWSWVAIDADTKLVPCWVLGPRDTATGYEFIQKLRSRVDGRFQLTTDGYAAYPWAIELIFGKNIDYGCISRNFWIPETDHSLQKQHRIYDKEKTSIVGNPNMDKVSTSFIERQNLTMRMGLKRFNRLTNAHSKKLQNMQAAVALHFMYYNFARIHESVRSTPAMAAGLTDYKWSVQDIVELKTPAPKPLISSWPEGFLGLPAN